MPYYVALCIYGDIYGMKFHPKVKRMWNMDLVEGEHYEWNGSMSP